jgi:DNA-directed RNA polymerase subunit H (RpoH/RPB5)
MEADTIDQIIRSRPTILEVLKDRGYDVSTYENTSPEDILKLATTSAELLKIVVTQPAKEATPTEAASQQRAIVLYWVESSYRLRIENETNELWNDEKPMYYNPETDSVIILLAEPFHPMFDVQAAKQWNIRKARISFFNMKNLISNPLRHIMQPEFRKLSADETAQLVQRLHLKSKKNLPHIVYHVDMAARVLGLVPGDVVHFKRGSETCGEVDGYRICVV